MSDETNFIPIPQHLLVNNLDDKDDKNDLKTQLLNENNIDNINDIIDLFNVQFKKRDIARLSTLNDLQDKISEQMYERLSKKADQFSNKDLIDYFKAIQDAMSIKDETLSKINNPAIQINQQQLNVNINTELNNDSRERVLDIVKQIINDGNVDIIEDLEVDNND